MGHSYAQNLIHCVYSTEGRRNLIKPELQGPLWAFKGSIAKQIGIHLISAGGHQITRTYLSPCPQFLPWPRLCRS